VQATRHRSVLSLLWNKAIIEITGAFCIHASRISEKKSSVDIFLNLKARCRLLEDLSFDFPKFRALQFAPIFTFFLICEELAEDIGDTIYKISYDLS